MYTPKVTELLLNPINSPAGSYYNGTGSCKARIKCKANPKRITVIEVKFLICVENGAIKLARHEIFGDPVAMATGSFCVQAFKNKTLQEARECCTIENAISFLKLQAGTIEVESCLPVLAAAEEAINSYKLQLDESL